MHPTVWDKSSSTVAKFSKRRMFNYWLKPHCINDVVRFTCVRFIILDSSYLDVVICECFWVAPARSKIQQNNLKTQLGGCQSAARGGITKKNTFGHFLHDLKTSLSSPCRCLSCKRSWPSLDRSAWTWTQTAPWDTAGGCWSRSAAEWRGLCLLACRYLSVWHFPAHSTLINVFWWLSHGSVIHCTAMAKS